MSKPASYESHLTDRDQKVWKLAHDRVDTLEVPDGQVVLTRAGTLARACHRTDSWLPLRHRVRTLPGKLAPGVDPHAVHAAPDGSSVVETHGVPRVGPRFVDLPPPPDDALQLCLVRVFDDYPRVFARQLFRCDGSGTVYTQGGGRTAVSNLFYFEAQPANLPRSGRPGDLLYVRGWERYKVWRDDWWQVGGLVTDLRSRKELPPAGETAWFVPRGDEVFAGSEAVRHGQYLVQEKAEGCRLMRADKTGDARRWEKLENRVFRSFPEANAARPLLRGDLVVSSNLKSLVFDGADWHDGPVFKTWGSAPDVHPLSSSDTIHVVPKGVDMLALDPRLKHGQLLLRDGKLQRVECADGKVNKLVDLPNRLYDYDHGGNTAGDLLLHADGKTSSIRGEKADGAGPKLVPFPRYLPFASVAILPFGADPPAGQDAWLRHHYDYLTIRSPDGVYYQGPPVALIDSSSDMPKSAEEGDLAFVKGSKHAWRYTGVEWSLDLAPEVTDLRPPPMDFERVVLRDRDAPEAFDDGKTLVVAVGPGGTLTARYPDAPHERFQRFHVATDLLPSSTDYVPGDLAYSESNGQLYVRGPYGWDTDLRPVQDHRVARVTASKETFASVEIHAGGATPWKIGVLVVEPERGRVGWYDSAGWYRRGPLVCLMKRDDDLSDIHGELADGDLACFEDVNQLWVRRDGKWAKDEREVRDMRPKQTKALPSERPTRVVIRNVGDPEPVGEGALVVTMVGDGRVGCREGPGCDHYFEIHKDMLPPADQRDEGDMVYLEHHKALYAHDGSKWATLAVPVIDQRVKAALPPAPVPKRFSHVVIRAPSNPVCFDHAALIITVEDDRVIGAYDAASGTTLPASSFRVDSSPILPLLDACTLGDMAFDPKRKAMWVRGETMWEKDPRPVNDWRLLEADAVIKSQTFERVEICDVGADVGAPAAGTMRVFADGSAAWMGAGKRPRVFLMEKHGMTPPGVSEGDLAYVRKDAQLLVFRDGMWRHDFRPVVDKRALSAPAPAVAAGVFDRIEICDVGFAEALPGRTLRVFHDGSSRLGVAPGPRVFLMEKHGPTPHHGAKGDLCYVQEDGTLLVMGEHGWTGESRPVIDRRTHETYARVEIRDGGTQCDVKGTLVVGAHTGRSTWKRMDGTVAEGPRVSLLDLSSQLPSDATEGDLAYRRETQALYVWSGETGWVMRDMPVADLRASASATGALPICARGPYNAEAAGLAPDVTHYFQEVGVLWSRNKWGSWHHAAYVSDARALSTDSLNRRRGGVRLVMPEQVRDAHFVPTELTRYLVDGDPTLFVCNDGRLVPEMRMVAATPTDQPASDEDRITSELPYFKTETGKFPTEAITSSFDSWMPLATVASKPVTTPNGAPTMTSPTKTERAISQLKDDAADAGTRVMAKQFVKLAREPAVALLSRNLAPDDEGMRAKVAAFLETEMGTAVMQMLLSSALMVVPESAAGGELASDISRELRVAFMADAGDMLAEVVVAPLREVMSKALAGTPAIRVEIAPEASAPVIGVRMAAEAQRDDGKAIPLVTKR